MMSDSPGPTSRPWWSRMRFSVRALVVFVLVIAAALGWVARGARLQRQAAIAIRRAGGQVWYDYPATGTWRGIRVPEWLGGAIGIDYLGNIRLVDLQRQGSDVELAHVHNLPRLDNLNLHGAPITDRGLAHLKGLHDLHWLNLDKTRLTDAGVAHLAGLERLQDLYLDDSRITDAGLKHLGALHGLVRLSLQGTAITDAGLKHLGGLNRLRKLSLDRTAITDAGAEVLQLALPDLEIYLDRGLYRPASVPTRRVSLGSKRGRRSPGG